MRLWSIHPRYLDRQGLIALWREGLLAQKVLLGNTKGYINHPQLRRFKVTGSPVGVMAEYLRSVTAEATVRGYRFDRGKIAPVQFRDTITVTSGQINYEFNHLLQKLKLRDPKRFELLRLVKRIDHHPLFRKVEGELERWEKVH